VDPALFAGMGAALRVEGLTAELQLNDQEIDACVDRLRSAGVSIRALVPRKLSLEESFIGLVQERKQ